MLFHAKAPKTEQRIPDLQHHISATDLSVKSLYLCIIQIRYDKIKKIWYFDLDPNPNSIIRTKKRVEDQNPYLKSKAKVVIAKIHYYILIGTPWGWKITPLQGVWSIAEGHWWYQDWPNFYLKKSSDISWEK